MYRFLRGLVGPNDADDCFQETFLAALRAYPDLRSGENLRGWILTIAGRKAIDTSRTKRRRPVPVPDVVQLDVQAANGHVELIDTDEPLWKAVRALPDRQRVALVQRVLLDRSYPQLAALMSCSVQTARAHVYQALKSLREANLVERMKEE